MWKRRTRFWITGILVSTVTVITPQASPSGYVTENHLFETSARSGTFDDSYSLSEMASKSSGLTINGEKVSWGAARHSRLRYATDTNMWRGIRPLVSTRAQVERLLGAPTDSLEQTFMYENGSDKINVLYSRAVCEQTEAGRWNVPKDTVLKVKVIPQRILLIRALKFDRSKYQRIREAHPENWVHYINLDQGITIDAEIRGGREEVMSLVYEPSSRQKSIRCAVVPTP